MPARSDGEATYVGYFPHECLPMSKDTPAEEMNKAEGTFIDREPFDKFEVAVETIINKLSLENVSDTPDYISAEFLRKVFELFNLAIRERTRWYYNPQKESPPDAGKEREAVNQDEAWDEIKELFYERNYWSKLKRELSSKYTLYKQNK